MKSIKQDIQNDLKNYSLQEVLEKYDLSFEELFKYCLKKNNKYNIKIKKVEETFSRKYIQEYHNAFRIRKSIKGKLIYFGYYNTLDDAIRVRNRLIDYKWDKDILPKIYEELNIKPIK